MGATISRKWLPPHHIVMGIKYKRTLKSNTNSVSGMSFLKIRTYLFRSRSVSLILASSMVIWVTGISKFMCKSSRVLILCSKWRKIQQDTMTAEKKIYYFMEQKKNINDSWALNVCNFPWLRDFEYCFYLPVKMVVLQYDLLQLSCYKFKSHGLSDLVRHYMDILSCAGTFRMEKFISFTLLILHIRAEINFM